MPVAPGVWIERNNTCLDHLGMGGVVGKADVDTWVIDISSRCQSLIVHCTQSGRLVLASAFLARRGGVGALSVIRTAGGEPTCWADGSQAFEPGVVHAA